MFSFLPFLHFTGNKTKNLSGAGEYSVSGGNNKNEYGYR